MNSVRVKASQEERPAVPWMIWGLALVYFFFFSLFSYFLYKNLLYGDFDLAVHAQTMWNLCHGSAFSSILGVPFLANHFIPAFFGIRYFYAILPSPVFLLILQSLSLATGVVFSYMVARRFVETRWATLVALLYFFYPAVGYANIFEFHPTTLAVPFLFLMILAYAQKRWVGYVSFSLLAMMFQENIPLAVFMMGVLSLMQKRAKGWAIYSMAVSVLWFYLAVLKIQPALNRGIIEFGSIYSHLGGSPQELVKNVLLKPWLVFGPCVSGEALIYLLKIFAPLLFLPVLGWQYCLPVGPFLIQHLLSSRVTERSLQYHYMIEMVPFFVWASSEGVRWVLQRWANRWIHSLMILAFIASFFVTAVLISPYIRAFDRLERFTKSQELLMNLRLLEKIPPAAPVVATFRFLPPLSQRSQVYSFHHVTMGTYTLSLKPYRLPDSTEYALLDMNDRMTLGFETAASQDNLRRFVDENPWRVVDFGLDTILMKKDRKDLSALYEVNPPVTGKPDRAVKAYSADRKIKLEGFSMTLGQQDHADQIGIKFFWRALMKPDAAYGLLLTLVNSKQMTVDEYLHPVGYRLNPTTNWRTADRVTENFWYCFPPKLSREPLEMRVGLVDLDKKRIVPFISPLKSLVDGDGRIKLDTLEPS